MTFTERRAARKTTRRNKRGYASETTKDLIRDKMVVNKTFDTEFGIGYEIISPPYAGRIIFEITVNDGDKQTLRAEAKRSIEQNFEEAQLHPFDNFNISQKYLDMQ